MLITGVDGTKEIPAEFTLSQNYLNPFNPSTVIRYGLPERVHVRLEVFNLLGQRIGVLVDDVQYAGYHSTELDGSALSSGVYIYRLSASALVRAKRLLLLR